jgi:single-stranded-DNA-specific exonuclease
MRKWHLQSSITPDSVATIKDILLDNRQITNKEDFYNPKSPYEIGLADLGISEEVASQIKQKLEQIKTENGKILIFGDYDADGINATAILWRALHSLGYQALPFIPSRLKHGYGLSVKALQEILAVHDDAKLLITVDNGIVAHRALQFLAKEKIEVIVTDHHQPDETVPEAFATFHSTQICGAAVAWFLARYLGTKTELLDELMALMAIATITDLMPLVGVNRSIVLHGLTMLRKTKSVGLQHLLQIAGIQAKNVDAYHIGFQIGPRLNAMGRLADSMNALRLLCTNNPSKARDLSQLLQNTNQDRQEMTEGLFESAVAMAETMKDEVILIVDSPDFHEGIIGLLAGRLTERFHKPSIVINSAAEVAKASARSLSGFHITDFIREFASDLLEFGGHPLAAGFALSKEAIDVVRPKMLARAKEILANKPLTDQLEIDMLLPMSMMSVDLVKELDQLAPFGLANPKPVFLIEKVQVFDWQLLGKERSHLKFKVRQAEQSFEVLAWRKAALLDQLNINQSFDLVCQLEENIFREQSKVQLVLQDLRPSKSV